MEQFKGHPQLPFVPLWQGAAYRLVMASGTVLPTRLSSLDPSKTFPRMHEFEHLDESLHQTFNVKEIDRGLFELNEDPVLVELA